MPDCLDQITPLILTYNEEANISRTLTGLSWARRIVVIDSFSTDATLELLAEYSPELVCVIGGFLEVEARSAEQIRNNAFQGHFTIGAQARGYTPADALVLGDLGTGPACRGLPKAPIP